MRREEGRRECYVLDLLLFLFSAPIMCISLIMCIRYKSREKCITMWQYLYNFNGENNLQIWVAISNKLNIHSSYNYESI